MHGFAFGAETSQSKTLGYELALYGRQTSSDPFQRQALATFLREPSQPFSRLERLQGELSLRYATADVIVSQDSIAFSSRGRRTPGRPA